ncbi:MAG: AcrR family transcriptional regulator [bacterium]
MKRQKYEDTEVKIIQAAMQIFSEKGFKAATTKIIAKEAQVSEVTLFRHYKSKSELFQQILKQLTDKGFCSSTIINESLDPVDGVRFLILKMFEIFEEHSQALRLLLYALIDDEVTGFEDVFVKNNIIPGLQFLTGIFTELQATGKVSKKVKPSMMAELLIAQVFGVLENRRFMQHSPIAKEKKDELCEAIMEIYIFS